MTKSNRAGMAGDQRGLEPDWGLFPMGLFPTVFPDPSALDGTKAVPGKEEVGPLSLRVCCLERLEVGLILGKIPCP
jgi:hypothetical protein